MDVSINSVVTVYYDITLEMMMDHGDVCCYGNLPTSSHHGNEFPSPHGVRGIHSNIVEVEWKTLFLCLVFQSSV